MQGGGGKNFPLDGLALGEVHRFGQGVGEVHIPLVALLALDFLNFGWVSHRLRISIDHKDKESKQKIALFCADSDPMPHFALWDQRSPNQRSDYP